MIDTALHSLLGLAIAGSTLAAFFLLGPFMAAGVVGAWDIFYREVTQAQAKHYDFDFRRGWNPFAWSAAKNMETWVPVAVVLAVAFCVQLIVP